MTNAMKWKWNRLKAVLRIRWHCFIILERFSTLLSPFTSDSLFLNARNTVSPNYLGLFFYTCGTACMIKRKYNPTGFLGREEIIWNIQPCIISITIPCVCVSVSCPLLIEWDKHPELQWKDENKWTRIEDTKRCKGLMTVTLKEGLYSRILSFKRK